jgi:outer membrane protein assembly factor BamB
MGESDRDHRTIREQAADSVYLTASDGKLYAIDYKGRLRWSFLQELTSPPIVLGLPDGQDIVVVAGARREPSPVAFLWGLRGATGEVLWKIPLDSPVRGSPAVHANRIYVATQTSLYAIGYERSHIPEPHWPTFSARAGGRQPF